MAPLSSVPRRLGRNQRLFWRREFAPLPDMLGSPNFSVPDFFYSFPPQQGIRSYRDADFIWSDQ
jgi:hypothetical protein